MRILLIFSPILFTILLLRWFRFSLPISWLAAALVAQITVLEFDIGPASLRMYIMGGMGYFYVLHLFLSRRRIFQTQEARKLFVIFLCFLVWMMVNDFYNGNSLGKIIYRMVSTHIYYFSAFTLTQFFLNTSREAIMLAGVMTLTTLASAFFGILQWLNISWAWDIARLLHPVYIEEKGDLFATGFVQGLESYSMPYSTHLISFGMFIFAWVLFGVGRSRRYARMLLGGSGVVLLSLGILFSQSRSATYGSMLAVSFLVYSSTIKNKNMTFTRKILPLILVAVVFLGTGRLLQETENLNRQDSGRWGRYKLSRIFELQDNLRMQIVRRCLELFQQHWFLGAGMEKYNYG